MGKFIFIILAVIVLVVVAWYGSQSLPKIINQGLNPSTVTPIPTNIVETIPPTQPPQSSEVNIKVSSPVSNQTVSSPLIVTGEARVFENIVSIEFKDSSGKILYTGTAYANAPDVGQFGIFKADIKYITNEKSGTLTVFQASARDGSRIDVVVIPLLLN